MGHSAGDGYQTAGDDIGAYDCRSDTQKKDADEGIAEEIVVEQFHSYTNLLKLILIAGFRFDGVTRHHNPLVAQRGRKSHIALSE